MTLLLDTHTFLWFWWAENIPIVSADVQLDAYGVTRIW
jgi:PIN domain nuclease of toxin-antitoxin system